MRHQQSAQDQTDPQFANCGSARLRYFTFTRKANTCGASPGVSITLASVRTARRASMGSRGEDVRYTINQAAIAWHAMAA